MLAFEVEETLDAGPHVIAFVRVLVTGRSSGAEPVARGPHVWTFRNGEAIRFQLMQERHEALEAVGLRQ